VPDVCFVGLPILNPYKISMTPPKNLGMFLLAIWLILFGLLTSTFLGFSFSHSGDVLGILAIVTGALLVMQR